MVDSTDAHPSHEAPDDATPRAPQPGETEAEQAFAGQVFLGTAAIVYATAVVFLAMADHAVGLRFMPRSWYINRPLWYSSVVLGYVAGFYLLRPTRGERPWQPGRPGVRFTRLVLYTRDGCHLCEDAREILDRYAAWLPPPEEIDIDTDPQLVERFGTTIPVIEIDGRVRLGGRINEVLLRRLIEGAPPGRRDRQEPA